MFSSQSSQTLVHSNIFIFFKDFVSFKSNFFIIKSASSFIAVTIAFVKFIFLHLKNIFLENIIKIIAKL